MTPLIHYERQRWKKVNFFAKKKTTSSVFVSTCSNAVHAQFHWLAYTRNSRPCVVLGPIWKKRLEVDFFFKSSGPRFWSPRWVENDKRKRFGGVVENCEVQTLSKNRFFLSVRHGRRRGMRLTPWVSISLRFTADVFVICRRCRGTASMAELACETLKCSRCC